jgi:hypothetical protein
MPINLKKGSNNKLNVSDFIKKSSKTSPPAGSFGKQSDTQTKEQINAQQDVEGQQRLDTPPAQGESQGKQAGSTTLIPNIAAEIAAVAKKSLRPLSIVKTGSKLIMRNLKKGVSHIKTLGNGGKRIARDIELITARTTQKANSDILDIKKVYRKVSKKNREKIAKVLNGRTTDAPNWIKQRANKLREILDRSMNEASKLGVERKLPDGTKLPLKGSGKAFPQILNEAGKQMLEEAENEGLGSKRVFAVAQELVQQEQAESIDEAVILLQQFRKQQLRRANSYLEQSRVELPEEYIEWDGREVLPSLIQKNWLTVEGVRQWGTDTAEQSFPKARARIEQIRTEKGSYEANKVESFIETGFGLGADVSPRIRNISDVIRGYQFDTKIALSLPTILRNMFDRIAKGMTISPVMHFKTYLKYPPFINKLIKSARSLEEEMVRRGAVFSHGSIAEGYEPGSFATKTMGKPFSSSERGNQVHIALTSYYKLMRDVELLQKKTKGDKLANHLADKISGILGRSSGQVKYRLKEMGLEGDVIDNLQEGQKLTEEQVNTILHEAVRDKAFPMIMSTKPIWYDNHPMVKVLMQFKTWPIRQTEMIWNDVAKYTVKTGDPTRLLGFLVGTLIAGEMYNIVRDYLTDRDESILRYMLETEDEETKEIVKRIGTDLLDGGVVGMFADFTYGIWDWAKGVSANTLSNVSETALHIKKRPELTPQALMQLLKKEASPARQVTTYIDKIDRKFINKKNLTKNFYKYRRKAWEFRNDYNNPTLKEQIQKSTEDIFWGKQDYRPGENTLSYRLAARQITVGDFKDAGKYIKIVLDSGTKLSTVKRTLESWYSPLGPIKNDKMKEFYKQLTPKERNEARELQKKWRTNMYKAINQAR